MEGAIVCAQCLSSVLATRRHDTKLVTAHGMEQGNEARYEARPGARQGRVRTVVPCAIEPDAARWKIKLNPSFEINILVCHLQSQCRTR